MPRGLAVAATCLVGFTFASMGAAALAGSLASPSAVAEGESVADIPPHFLAAYRAAADRFDLGVGGWAYLAGIGKVESDHGRSSAPGVHAGQNANGCCAGPMQFDNGGGRGGGTWGSYGVDGDGDGRANIYDPDDAVSAAARYLRASGAPADWRSAIFAYNHAEWYVERVVRQAAVYREGATAWPTTRAPRVPGQWLAALPGFPGERCDARIVADVMQLAAAYRVRVTDCFGGAPHEVGGEHPLGLATDLVPVDGNWRRTARLATNFGWSRACAQAGCPGHGPFRVILYNGYPGHGDPGHSASPHLHLSWNHGPAAPFSPAPWVRTVLFAGATG